MYISKFDIANFKQKSGDVKSVSICKQKVKFLNVVKEINIANTKSEESYASAISDNNGLRTQFKK